MNIDLTDLLTNKEKEIILNEKILVSLDLLSKTNIKRLNDVIFKGILCKENEIIKIKGDINGQMILPDDLTLEDVSFTFNIKIDEQISEYEENFENNLKIINNSLDIFPFLWQNILLEVPSKIRGTNNISKLSGDNWKVITEEELASSNQALSELKSLLDKRKE